jgi:hypothetical protein
MVLSWSEQWSDFFSRRNSVEINEWEGIRKKRERDREKTGE